MKSNCIFHHWGLWNQSIVLRVCVCVCFEAIVPVLAGDEEKQMTGGGLAKNTDWMHMISHKASRRRTWDNEVSQNKNSALTSFFQKRKKKNPQRHSFLLLYLDVQVRKCIQMFAECRNTTHLLFRSRLNLTAVQKCRRDQFWWSHTGNDVRKAVSSGQQTQHL